MDTAPEKGTRVTVPLNVGGAPTDAPGSVDHSFTQGTKTTVVVKLDRDGETVSYPLDAVQPLKD